MPHKIEDGHTLNLLSVNLCVDFGGRQAECEFQDSEHGGTVHATYLYLSDKWSLEGWGTKDLLTLNLRRLFLDFDTGEDHNREAWKTERDIENIKIVLRALIVWIAQSASSPIGVLDAEKLLKWLDEKEEIKGE